MKSILLASASIVAFTIAGAASAEVSFTGEATLGFNDDDDNVEDDHDGFYWDANIAVTLSQMLDNGLTVTGEFDFDVNEDNLGQVLESGGWSLTIASEYASIIVGDTAFAAETYWSGVGDLDSDGFSEADGEVVLRSEVMFGSFTAGLSYVIADADGDIVGDDPTVDGDVDQLSVGGTGEFGMFSVGFAYQAESDSTGGSYDPAGANGDFNTDEIFGLFAGATVGAADLSFAYASNQTDDTNSFGVGISYPFGPVVAGLELGFNPDNAVAEMNYEVTIGYSQGPVTVDFAYSDDENGDDTEFSIDGSYDVGNGLTVLAGLHGGDDATNETDFYVGAEQDLGGGASLTISYAVDDDDSEEDEIGAPDYQEGTTVEFTFEF